MKVVTDGLVIKETSMGEADRLITILTKDNGIIRAYAAGAKSIKSKRGSGTSLLSYSNFSLTKTGDTYRLSEATPIKLFFSTDSDIETLAISQYFCELCSVFEPTDKYGEEFLRLVLNSLHFLTEKKKDAFLIKAITELRIATVSGYCPNLVGCDKCGAFTDDIMCFNVQNGSIFCNNCNENSANIPLNKTLLDAMRHIVYSPFVRLYSFEIPKNDAMNLSKITEKYILYQVDHKFLTLEFLHSVL